MITKSHYVTYTTCPRAYYYLLHDPNQAQPTDEIAQKRIDEGKIVGNYAHLYFDNTVKVKANPDVVNITKQVEITKKLLPTSNYIAEASFQFEDLFCAVDILAKNGNGYDIYEVKAATDIGSDHLKQYLPDVVFQKYVLELCGLEIKNCYILHLNPDYIRQGDIDVKQMLKPYQLNAIHEELKKPDKVLNLFKQEYEVVASNIAAMRKLSKLPTYGRCKDCDFWLFCHKDLPQPNVLDLSGMWSSKAHNMINHSIITYEQILANKERLSEFKVKLTPYQMVQMQTHLSKDKKPYINKDIINHFFQSLKFPIYHLDFETMNEAVPPFDGVGCYNQVPFQYSLHIQYAPEGKTEHKEFLGSQLDSEYKLAKQLCNDIPLDVMSMSYNMSFERSVLKHLAQRFPDLSDHLMNIHDHMVDLLIPFRDSCFYSVKQNGSNSIKYVMPAMCPEMEKAYKQLPIVHNGGEALTMFPKMIKMSGEQLEKTRKGMLDYCCLDTLSMVEVLNALWKLIR